MLIDFVYHSTLGLRVTKNKKKGLAPLCIIAHGIANASWVGVGRSSSRRRPTPPSSRAAAGTQRFPPLQHTVRGLMVKPGVENQPPKPYATRRKPEVIHGFHHSNTLVGFQCFGFVLGGNWKKLFTTAADATSKPGRRGNAKVFSI